MVQVVAETPADELAADPVTVLTDPLAATVAQVCTQLRLGERYPDAVGPVTPVVLRRRQNAIVRCDPYPVIAKVANWTGTVRREPERQLRNEVGLARWAGSRQVAVLTPLPGHLCGPHEVDGIILTLWPLWEEARPATDPGALGKSLAALHRATAGYPGKLLGPTQIAQDADGVMTMLAQAGVLPADEAMLVADEALDAAQALQKLIAELPPEKLTVLHGDAVRENTWQRAGDPGWFDLEDTWRGPVEWDLACLSLTPGWSPRQAEIAIRAYCLDAGHTLDEELLHACRRLRHAQLEAWQAVGH